MSDPSLFCRFIRTCQERIKIFEWLHSDSEIKAFVENCLKNDENGWADEIDDPTGDSEQKIMALHILKAAYRYDDECLEGEEAYGHLIESFAQLAGTDFRVEDVQVSLSDMDEEWTLKVFVNGHEHEFSLDYFGDYVPNEELVDSLNDILRQQSVQGRFYLVGSGEPTMMYLRPIQWELNRQTKFIPVLESSGRNVDDLE